MRQTRKTDDLRRLGLWQAVLVLSVLATSCNSTGSAARPQAATRVPVSVITAQPEDVPIYTEFAAQTFARDLIEVRARVDGFIEKRSFDIGSDVKAGDVLYELDRQPYEAAVEKARGDLEQSEANVEFARRQVGLAQAQANLAQAEANQLKTQQDVNRLQPLVKEDAAAQQDLDNAVASLKANQANVEANKANVEQARLSTKAQIDTAQGQLASAKALLKTAELNLKYATIIAPVSGRIGDASVAVGGLVTTTSARPLTTIVPLDPIWVRFKVSESFHLDFQARSDRDEELRQPLELILANNSVHPQRGRYVSSLNEVDPKTGTLEVQAMFPNPTHIVLPGQFGRVRVILNQKRNAILVPQRAVLELQGAQSVYTVDAASKVLARSVVTGDRVGERWIIEQGLKPGDRVIVEGVQKIRPGSDVAPDPYVPAAAAQTGR